MAKSTKTNVKSNGNASMTIQEILDECGCGKIKMVDFKFMDLPGTLQHVSIPADKMSPDQFEEGHGFDGSSIRSFAHINESDMLLIPDPSTAIIDPIYQIPTMSMICNVKDPGNGQRYARDPRHVAQKAEEYLRSTRIADTAYFGPELEFFVFDSVRFDQGQNYGFYHLDSNEGIWNSGNNDGPNLGHRPRNKEGYFPVPLWIACRTSVPSASSS